MLHRLWTEGESPSRQAAAVGVGLFIGATPFYGFHLPLTLALGSVFGLNRLKVYLASNISNPLVAPLLYAAEIQVGGWVRNGSAYSFSPASLARVDAWSVAQDLLLGSMIVGGALAVCGGVSMYVIASRPTAPAALARLIDDASGRYLRTSFTAWQVASGKLRTDPVYRRVLEQGVLPDEGTLLDLGCGQGLVLALIASARDLFGKGEWPAGWPAPPRGLRLRGIEVRPRSVRQARAALGEAATIEVGDIRTARLPSCCAALLFDVLHLLSRDDQDRVLRRITAVLASDGVLVVREADAAGGWRFRAVRLGNRAAAIARGRWNRSFQYRTAAEWRDELASLGYVVRIQPTGEGTPFANVVLYGERTKRDSRDSGT